MAKEQEEIIGITVKREDDFAEWYSQVVEKAELADHAPIRGCIVFRPYSFAIWEGIQKFMDSKIKAAGHKNAYFPLFIPESFLTKEAEHIEGFAPEVGWIETKDENEERVAVRPTSETIMYDSYSKWVQSYRDLPILINQWCNVVRWETKVTKPFIRTREFLWQEGHTAHVSKEEADKEVNWALDLYKELAEEVLAIPVIQGIKSDSEKFAGALYTTTIEGLMPDGKALQMGTSHNLGQNFAKSFNIRYLDENKEKQYVWQTSWGVSTRLVGAVIMAHGDNKGLVLPPKIAPIQVVIVPIIFEKNKDKILKKVREIKENIGTNFRVELDERENYSPGWKFNQWELKGVPIRLEFGPKDMEKDQCVLVRRDTCEKSFVKLSNLNKELNKMLEDIQHNLFRNAKKFLKNNIYDANSLGDLVEIIANKKGMARAGWCESEKCEQKVKDQTAATIRVIPFKGGEGKGKCVACGKDSEKIVYLARAY